ncbi:MAG: hypothetical protein ACRCV7_04850 [Culicoidibacterales bacterium]
MEMTNGNSNTQVAAAKLPKASKVALIGMAIVVAGTVIDRVYSYFYSMELAKIMKEYALDVPENAAAKLIGIALNVAFLALFIWLALRLKKAKTKAIAVNLVVFSSILVGLGVIGILIMPFAINVLQAVPSVKSNALNQLRSMVSISQLIAIISLVGWSTVLAGGIIGVRATEEELEENRLAE